MKINVYKETNFFNLYQCLRSFSIIIMLAVIVLTCFSIQFVVSAPYKVPEGVDIDQILANERLSDSYAECLLDKKPCSAEGQKLKGKLLFIRMS